MPLDPHAQTLLESLGEMSGGLSAMGVEEARKAIELFGTLDAGVEVARVEDLTIPEPSGDIPARLYAPEGEGPLPVVVYFHGGGWVIGNIASHDGICRKLANASGCAIVSVEYRLAPEHRFPVAPSDCYTAVSWIKEHGDKLGIDTSRMAVAGDSAGGNLSAVIAQLCRDRGGPAIAFQLLIYPATDLTMSHPSIEENADGYLLTKADMEWFRDHYLGDGADPKDPLVSPLYAGDLSGLPPALVLTAEYDPLRDEGEAYATALQQAGVDARSSRYDGLIHGFFGLEAVIPAAAPAMEEAAAALRHALNP
jgi:acetyl esterase